MTTVDTADVVAGQTRIAEETLREVEDLLRAIDDADLHRAEPNGGWTGAIIVGHRVHHQEQRHGVLRSRGRLPERFDRDAAATGAEG